MSKILFIEDNPEIYEINQKYLNQQGFDTFVATGGKAALSLLDKHSFDCIVLDVLLPDTDGFALCAPIREKTAAPVIFLTCLDDTEDKIKGLMLGGDDYMTKPHDMKELAARIRVQLRRASEVSLTPEQNAITIGKNIVQFSPKEFALILIPLISLLVISNMKPMEVIDPAVAAAAVSPVFICRLLLAACNISGGAK